MNNIKFDNPLLLIVGIALLAITIISFVIAIKKDNKTINNVISFSIHIVICVLLTLALAKTTFEKVITQTHVYVLADISYSTNKNLDLIDEYIKDLEENSPRNSKIGVITFGKDYELLVEPGERLVSVKESKVDDSATNIVEALEYCATLFEDNVIKRIVIISDGEETKDSNIVSVVQEIASDDVYIDAIYLNSNIDDDDKEVQINSVDYTKSVYLDNVEYAYAIVQSSYETKAILNLYHNDELYDQLAINLNKGYNSFTFKLNTSISGVNKYKLTVEAQDDYSVNNNTYLFSQEVSDRVKMLFISSSNAEKAKAEELYGANCDIDFYTVTDRSIPTSIEDLVKYDEFVISNIDIRNIQNYSEFVVNIDTLVSQFGKSLITFGNTYIQNNEGDETLDALSNMLPVKFGKSDQSDKVVAILLDISRSMEQLGKFEIAKETACTILDNLDDEVNVIVTAFFGEVGTVYPVVKAKERETIKTQIRNLEAYQGTFLGSGLEYTYDLLSNLTYNKKEMLLISDGLPYGEQAEKAVFLAQKMAGKNIILSTINTVTTGGIELMTQLASLGRGYYYYIEELKDVKELVLNDVLNSLNEVVLEGSSSPVSIALTKDKLVEGVVELPSVNGLYNNQKKPSAKVVLEATYTDITSTEYVVPLYAYWSYGNGIVSSYASTLTGSWASNMESDIYAQKFFSNILGENIPNVLNDSAFIVTTEQVGTNTNIIVSAPQFNQKASLKVKITYPDKTILEKDLVYDTMNYTTLIETMQIGEYIVEVSYEYGEMLYTSNYIFDVSYLPEYNSFTIFEASNLYYMVSSNGQVSEDGKLVLENNNSIIQKYIIDFTPSFMIICVILFVIDVMIRKLRWQDIKSLFKKTVKIQEGGNKNDKK